MKTVKARCHVCGSQHTFQNQTLDDVRTKTCERCNVRLTVTSSDGQIDPPAVPARELVFLTKREQETARQLLVTAFEEGA